MQRVEVSQRVEFSCCYVVVESSGVMLNSHQYKFEATAYVDSYDPAKNFRVLSFEDFKDLCLQCVPNGMFIYNKLDLGQYVIARSFKDYGVDVLEFDSPISAERICHYISSILLAKLTKAFPSVNLKETKLRETANSYVTWTPEEEHHGF